MASSAANGAAWEGHPFAPGTPGVTRSTPAQGAARDPALVDALGRAIPRTDDPAWQPPTDPLASGVKPGTIHREIPQVGATTTWTVAQTRSALVDLVVGQFDEPSQLVDAVMGDARVQSAMESRTGGLLGRDVEFIVPRKHRGSAAAEECRAAFEDAWPGLGGEEVLGQIDAWAIMIGGAPAQMLWDMSGEYATPVVSVWHPRYTYYHWTLRTWVALTLDGQTPITPGDGTWILHAPKGAHRGWMRSAIRAVAQWWLARNFALRDWARYSERHGMPVIKAKTPAAGLADDVARFRSELSTLGQESVIQLPQGVDKDTIGYDVEYLETTDQAWKGFEQLIAGCNVEITLALMSQNLTSEVREGSFAAARVHADVRQSLLEADARSLGRTVYSQIARPFALMNFGDADLAPLVRWDVRPYEDDETAAKTFLAFTQGVAALKLAGVGIDRLDALARRFGIDMGSAKFISAPAPTAEPAGEPDGDELDDQGDEDEDESDAA